MNLFDLRVPASHPSLAGHFPGNPVVPGVVILDMVTKCILVQHPDSRISGVPQVKFLAPLAPDVEFHLTWTEQPGGQIDFSCNTSDQRLVQGRIQLEKTQ